MAPAPGGPGVPGQVPGAPVAAAPAPPPPGPPGPCPDQVIGLTAEPSAARYGPGQPREFRMIITNTGPVPCFRDLSAALQEVLVFGPRGARLWSSNDCYGGGAPAVRELVPGQGVVSKVVWAGRTSEPGCPTQRRTVPPGDYRLVVRLGPLSSPPTPFHLD